MGKKLREEGTLKKKPVNRPFRKLDLEKLKQFLAKHPDAYLREIAVTYACRRLKITRKKGRALWRAISGKNS